MRKLFEIFKVLQFQKRIVSAATLWGNTVFICNKKLSYFHFTPIFLSFTKKIFTKLILCFFSFLKSKIKSPEFRHCIHKNIRFIKFINKMFCLIYLKIGIEFQLNIFISYALWVQLLFLYTNNCRDCLRI